MATNQGFKSIVPNENVNTEFLYYSLVLSKKQLLRLAAGSTFGEVSKSDFERIMIFLPPLEEQRRIAAVLNACDKEITLLKQQLDALKRQKRGLMQKLLTGQIRLFSETAP
jgi:type I restriction enzyme S subunit